MSSFDFKKFSLTDEHTPMKIGVDAVILGAWTQGGNVRNILDIGSGCGILSFILSQRYEGASISGVEIFEPAYKDSLKNLAHFYNKNKVRFFHRNIKEWENDSCYDIIISNPPYFSGGFLPRDKGRTIARFQKELSIEDIAKSVNNHLSSHGTFSLLMESSGFEYANKVFNRHGLFLYRKTEIKHNKQKITKRLLLEYRKQNQGKILNNKLIIKNMDGSFTNEFKSLTVDFYLDF